VRYADTSVIVRAYLRDEREHLESRRLVLESADPVVTSELSRVEFAAAIQRAVRARRIGDPGEFLRTFDLDCGPGSSLSLLPFERDPTLAEARRLAIAYGLKTMDAIQVAAALHELGRSGAPAGDQPFVFLTRDADQAAAARAEGLTVA